jgi:5-dehydro-4-deoxyglucarate dehydratase
MHPDEVKHAVGKGLLAFPVTHFDADGAFDEAAYRTAIAATLAHGPAALFVAGGTGEFFSLPLDECLRIVVAVAAGRLPIIAGGGYGTALAIEFACAAEASGAGGIVVLPPYLVKAEQEGLFRHLDAICAPPRSPSTATTACSRRRRLRGWPGGTKT